MQDYASGSDLLIHLVFVGLWLSADCGKQIPSSSDLLINKMHSQDFGSLVVVIPVVWICIIIDPLAMLGLSYGWNDAYPRYAYPGYGLTPAQ